METFKRVDLDDLQGDKVVKLSEAVFRIILLILAVIGFFKNDFIKIYNGSLLFYALLALAISYVPDLVKKTTKLYITSELRFIFLIYIFLAQFLGEIGDFFNKVSFWDTMLHLLSAFYFTLIGYIIVYLTVYKKETEKQVSLLFASLFAFSFSNTIGIFWEIFEYLVDIIFDFNMQKSGLVDTMDDLIACVIGSAITCLLYVYDIRSKKFSILSISVNKFVEINKK